MILALQAQAKIVLFSPKLTPLWSLKFSKATPPSAPVVYQTMLESLRRPPANIDTGIVDIQPIVSLDSIDHYLVDFDENYGSMLTPLLNARRRTFRWKAVEAMDYSTDGDADTAIYRAERLELDYFVLLHP
jgi:hypothetical protein